MQDFREEIRLKTALALDWLKQTSLRTRLFMALPVGAALLFAGMTVTLDIFLRDAARDPLDLTLHFLAVFIRLLVFFAPFTWATLKVVQKLRRRFRDRRMSEALLIGLYLPQAIAVLIILYAQLAGSEVIASLFAALVTWMMLSLLLSPVTVVLTFLAWSYLPKEMKLPALVPAGRKIASMDNDPRHAPQP